MKSNQPNKFCKPMKRSENKTKKEREKKQPRC